MITLELNSKEIIELGFIILRHAKPAPGEPPERLTLRAKINAAARGAIDDKRFGIEHEEK